MVYRKVTRLSGVLFLLVTVSQSNHVAPELPIQVPHTSPGELENHKDLLALSTNIENSVHGSIENSESTINLPLPESDVIPAENLVGQPQQQSNFDEPVLPHPSLPPNTETPSLLQLVEKSRNPPPPSEISGTFYMLHMVPPDLSDSPILLQEVSHSGLHQSLDGSHEHSGEVTTNGIPRDSGEVIQGQTHDLGPILDTKQNTFVSENDGNIKNNQEVQMITNHNPEEANVLNQNSGVVKEASLSDLKIQDVRPVENHQESHKLRVEISNPTVSSNSGSFQNLVHSTSHELSEHLQVATELENFGETDLNSQTFSSENSQPAFVTDAPNRILPVIDTLHSNQDISSDKEANEAKNFIQAINVENNVDGSKLQDDPFVDEVNSHHDLTNPSGSSSQVHQQVIPRTKSEQTDLSHVSSVEHTLYAEASPGINEVPRGINILPVAEKDSFISNDIHPQQYQPSSQSSEEQHQQTPSQEYQSPASPAIPITSDVSYQRDEQPVIPDSFNTVYEPDAQPPIPEVSSAAYQPDQPVLSESFDTAYQPEDQTIIPEVSDNSYQPADQVDLNPGSLPGIGTNRLPKKAGGGGLKPLFAPPVSGEGKGILQSGSEKKVMPYQFSYNVNDPSKGAEYGHSEDSDGSVVKGQYFVLLPDGRRQTVQYQADHVNGYQSEVEYQNGGASGGANALNQQIFNGGKGGNKPNNILPSGPLISQNAGNQYENPTISGNNNNNNQGQGSYNRQQFADNGAVAGNIQVNQQHSQSSAGGEKQQFQQPPNDNGNQYQSQGNLEQPSPSGGSFHQNPVSNEGQYQAVPENIPFPSINDGNQYQLNTGNNHDILNNGGQFPVNNGGQFPVNNGGQFPASSGGQPYQPPDSNNQHQPPTENHFSLPDTGNLYNPSNDGAQFPPAHGNSQSPPDAGGQYQIANDVGQFPPVNVGNQHQPVGNGDNFHQAEEYQPQSFDGPEFQSTPGNDVFQPFADGNSQYQSPNDGNPFQSNVEANQNQFHINEHQPQPFSGDEYQFSGGNNPQSHNQESFIQVLDNNDQFQPHNDGNQFQVLNDNQHQSYPGNEDFPPIGNQFEPNLGIPFSDSGDGNQFHPSSGNDQYRQEPAGNQLPLLGGDQYHDDIANDFSSGNQVVLGPGNHANGGNIQNDIANDFSSEIQGFSGPGQYENADSDENFQAFSEGDQYLLQNVDVRLGNEGHQAFSGEQFESFDNQNHGFQVFQEHNGSGERGSFEVTHNDNYQRPNRGSFEAVNENDNYQRPIRESLGISQANPPHYNTDSGQISVAENNIQQAQLTSHPSGSFIGHSDPQHKNCGDEFKPIEGNHSL